MGSSIGCLAAALLHAERGRRVRLFLQKGREGGSFQGLRLDGRHLDLGVRLFELDYEDRPEERLKLADFDRDRHNHRPFIDAVAAFIRRFIGDELLRVEAEMFAGGRRGRCIHFTTDLSGLPDLLDRRDCETMRAEIEAILRDPREKDWQFRPGHPARLDQIGLATASLDNHGALFHERFVRPHCARQTSGWEQTIASDRRRLWMALFHPVTLAEALDRRPPTFRPYRPFYRARAGLFVERLLEAVQRNALIEIAPVGRLERFARNGDTACLDFADSTGGPGRSLEIAAQRSVLGLTAEELFPAAGIAYAPERIRSGVAWVEIPESEILYWPALLSVHEPEMTTLRISTTSEGGPPGWRIATVETGSEAPSLDAIRCELEAVGIVSSGGSARLLKSFHGPAQTAASFDNRTRFTAARDSFAQLGWAGTVLGPARRFGFDSLNDQLVEALHLAEAQC
ncbi:MAG: NAD(P)/FAD-dependent oxidoreductase [Alphaproteobacteria bacterium]|nr:NAD(P)/FAD-dependent oxidoreductase [Alphaproteobacteria bacterium]